MFIKPEKTFEKIKEIFLVVVSFLALTIQPFSLLSEPRTNYWYDFHHIFSNISKGTNSLEAFFIFFTLLLFRKKLFEPIKNYKVLFACFVFIGIYLLCDVFSKLSSLGEVFTNRLVLFILVFKWALLSLLASQIGIIIIKRIEGIDFSRFSSKQKNLNFLYKVWFLLLVSWMPAFVVYFPGSAVYDALWQIALGGNWIPSSDHHPWPSSWLFFTLVNSLDLKDTGIYLLPLTIFIFFSEIFLIGLICLYIKKIINLYANDGWYIWISPLIYSVVPIYSMYGQTIIKDGIYSFSLTLFCSVFVYIFLSHSSSVKSKEVVILALTSFICFCFRHNGAYIILPSLVCLLIYFWHLNKASKPILILVVLLIAFQVGYKNIFLTTFNISKGSVVEKLALPSQTLAWIMKKEKIQNNFFDNEKGKSFFSSVTEVTENFQPEISDNIKSFIKLPISQEHLNSFYYFCTKYKKSCLEGVLAQTYLYFYPNRMSSVMPVVFNYNNSFESLSKNTNSFSIPDKINYFFANNYRIPFEYWVEFWAFTFPFSALMTPAYSTWILYFFVIALMIKGQNRATLILALPCLLTFFINILSPVNGDTRYSLPCIASEPILIFLIFFTINNRLVPKDCDVKNRLKFESDKERKKLCN